MKTVRGAVNSESNKLKRILFVVTEDWYFCSHRLPIARAARDAGFEVWVITRVNQHREQIINEGFNLQPLEFRRSGLNIFSDLATVWQLIAIYRKLQPDVVHHVAIKPVLYGSIASFFSPVSVVVNALAGLGFLYANDVKGVFRVIQPVVRTAMGFVLRRVNGKVIAQNKADFDALCNQMKIDSNSLTLIKGSGVDTQAFAVTDEPNGIVKITMVSRMLKEKGVEDLVKAAGLLDKKGVECLVSLVGAPDVENAGSVTEQELKNWAHADNVEWVGFCDDVVTVWKKTHIACLPSYYREGVPKSLLEAASCGRPIVSSDNDGCKEIVIDQVNGITVPAKKPEKLAQALELLIENPELRKTMGLKGRAMVEGDFSQEHVVSKTLSLYNDLLI